MEKTIKINLKDGTFDVEIRNMSLNHIKDLSAISGDVAENLKSVLCLSGATPDKADAGVSFLLQGKHDIRYILKGCLGATQILNDIRRELPSRSKKQRL